MGSLISSAASRSIAAEPADGCCAANARERSASDQAAGDESWIDELIPDGMPLREIETRCETGDETDLYRLAVEAAVVDVTAAGPSEHWRHSLALLRHRAYEKRLHAGTPDAELAVSDARAAEDYVIGEIRYALRNRWVAFVEEKIMPAIAKPKTRKLDQAAKDELLKRVMMFRTETWNNWESASTTGLPDDELRKLIEYAYDIVGGWLRADGTGEACFRKTFGLPIWFGTVKLPTRAPDLSGDKLILAVRRVMAIDLPAPEVALHGRHPANGDHHVSGNLPPSMTSTTLPDGIAVQNGNMNPGMKRKSLKRANGPLPVDRDIEVIELQFRGVSQVRVTLEIEHTAEGWAERMSVDHRGWLKDGRDANWGRHATTELFSPHKAPPCQTRAECIAFNLDRLQEGFAGIGRTVLSAEGRNSRTAAIEDIQLERKRLLANGSAVPTSQAVAKMAAHGVSVTADLLLPIEKIKPSAENTRKQFDEAKLRELGESMRDLGQIQALCVRQPDLDGGHEIIAGERRYRAAKLVGLATLKVQVVECTDADAAMIRLLENAQREDFNAIEEAHSLKILIEKYHCSQRDLEKKIDISQGQISNRLRLLNLPDVWQSRIISGEITPSEGRVLAAWSDETAVLNQLNKSYNRDKGRLDLKNALRISIRDSSEELEGHEWQIGAHWKIDSSDPELRVRECPTYGDETQRRAFNRVLAKQLKAAAIAKLKKKSAKKQDRAEASAKRADLSPEEKRRRTKQLKEQQAKKIYRYKIAWLQQRLIDIFSEPVISVPVPTCITWALWFACADDDYNRLDDLNEVLGVKKGQLGALRNLATEADATGLLRSVLLRWLNHGFEGRHTDLKPATIESFADQAGIDLGKEWRLDEEFLSLFTKDSLLDLAAEWKIAAKDGLETMKRGDLMKEILRLCPKAKAPERLLKVKEISLS